MRIVTSRYSASLTGKGFVLQEDSVLLAIGQDPTILLGLSGEISKEARKMMRQRDYLIGSILLTSIALFFGSLSVAFYSISPQSSSHLLWPCGASIIALGIVLFVRMGISIE